MLKAEAVQGSDEKIAKDIVLINRHSYPKGWEYPGAKEYYRQMLMNQKNICIMLRDDEKRVGFLLAIPHNDAVGELKGDDEFMEQDPKTYYIENVAILPGYRGEKGFSQMLEVLRQELRRRVAFFRPRLCSERIPIPALQRSIHRQSRFLISQSNALYTGKPEMGSRFS
jgi:hypothetical protein